MNKEYHVYISCDLDTDGFSCCSDKLGPFTKEEAIRAYIEERANSWLNVYIYPDIDEAQSITN